MKRPETEIRAELARWRTVRNEHMRARRDLEALAAALIVQTLAYALGEAPSPAMRDKVR